MSGDVFHLFTYGTLASAAHPSDREATDVLSGCERVAEASVAGTLYDLGEYPALLLGGGGRVHGEIWRCPFDRLVDLDRYEATDQGLFRRVAVRIGETPCWLYAAGPSLGPRLVPAARIASGRWLPRDRP